jgi:hypothetical protein
MALTLEEIANQTTSANKPKTSAAPKRDTAAGKADAKKIANYENGITQLKKLVAQVLAGRTLADVTPEEKKLLQGYVDGINASQKEIDAIRTVRTEENFPGTTGATKPSTTVSGPDQARLGKTTTTATSPVTPTITKDANGNIITQGKVKTPLPAKPGPAKPVTPKEPTAKPKTIDEIIALVTKEYGPIDSIFKTNEELGTLLRRAFDKKLTPTEFVNELENTTWFKTNAGEIQQRGFYKRQYEDLRKTTKDLETLDNTTTYGRGLKSTRQMIADEALREGVILDPAELDLMARDIYDNAYETTPAMIKATVRAKIKYSPNSILSGKAGEDLQDLKKIAAANGLDLDKAFGNSIQGWLQKVAQGESIETYKGLIRQAAKVGLPEKVGSLLDQGVDLETIYNPYRNILASTLEINPETITLNDPVLRSAIGPDKEMSLYDFQRQLRKDPRWQYTNNAREETSNAVMKVLQDFGFQG